MNILKIEVYKKRKWTWAPRKNTNLTSEMRISF